MLSGLRCRAYPTDALQAHLRRWIGHQRFIQNAKTSELAYFRAFARSALSLTGRAPLPDQAYSQFITEQTAFLLEVPSHRAVGRLSRAAWCDTGPVVKESLTARTGACPAAKREQSRGR
jgi:hypothetical protein